MDWTPEEVQYAARRAPRADFMYPSSDDLNAIADAWIADRKRLRVMERALVLAIEAANDHFGWDCPEPDDFPDRPEAGPLSVEWCTPTEDNPEWCPHVDEEHLCWPATCMLRAQREGATTAS
jgi:hypothetical protein